MAYTIRPLKEKDIPDVVEMMKPEKFHYPVSVLRSWMTLDPEGLLVVVSKTGAIMGMCSVVKNGEKVFFGGSYCVKKEYRNLDIGHKLFDLSFEHGRNGNMGCNITPDLLKYYKYRGFGVLETNWISQECETYQTVNPDVLEENLPEGVEILPYHETHFPAIIAYDYALMGFDRTEILVMSVHETDSLTLVAMKGRTCVGYGSIKLGILGVGRVGPLYADEPCLGEALMKRLIMGMPKVTGLALATVSNNRCANELVQKLGMIVEAKLHRVYTKARMVIDNNKIFAQFDVDFTCF